MISRAIKFIISNKILRKKAVEMLRNMNLNAFNISQLPIFDSFKDAKGNIVKLRKGLRSMIKPGWEQTFSEAKIQRLKDSEIQTKIKETEYFISTMIDILAKISNPNLSKILEIGSFDSIKSALLAKKLPNARVVSSDVEYYYDDYNLAQIQENRKLIQNKLGVTNLHFENDDITKSKFDNDTFDLIYSSDVLEHISDLESAFSELYRITKTGGVGYHVYNPFFSYNGGHTYATLDFPWGHASLDSEDFTRYLESFRYFEKEKASDFYFNNLNRCTLAEIESYIKKSGFYIHAILKETKFNQIKMLENNTLSMIKELYPNVKLEDLLSPIVTIIVEKKT